MEFLSSEKKCRLSVFAAGLLALASCGTSPDHGDSSAVPDLAIEPSVVETGLDATVGSVALQSDGKVIVGGGFSTPSRSLARFNPDGTPDTAFNTTVGDTIDKSVYAIAIQADGKIVVGGYFLRPSSALARFNPDGTPDTAFNTAVGDTIDLTVATVAVLPDGDYLAGGAFTSPHPSLARFNPDGTPDTAFNTAVGDSISGYVSTIEADDEFIVVGGQFETPANSLARFRLDGSADVDFNETYQQSAGSAMDAYVEKIALASDGSIVVGGWFAEPEPWLFRVAESGRLVSSGLGADLDGAVLSVTIDNGNLIVAGAFTSPARHLLRFAPAR